MSSEIPTAPKVHKKSSYKVRRVIQMWPLLVWAAVLALVVLLYLQRGSYVRVNGMVAANTEAVAPPEDGVILTVHVSEGDVVKKGQTLVTLDPTLIQKEIDDFKRNLPIAEIELKRKFEANRNGINADLQRAKADKAQSQARLNAAERELAFVQDQFDRQLALQPALNLAKANRDALLEEVKTHDDRIDALAKDLEGAEELLEELGKLKVPDELAVLEQRLIDKTLVASGDGTIQKIHKLRGVAQLGEPVLTLILSTGEGERPAKTVRAFVPQKENPEELEVGGVVWIAERSKNPVAHPATILSVAPDLNAIPNLGTPIPSQYIRGREFVCELPKELGHLLPGTGVHIFRKEPGKFNLWSFGKTPVRAAGN